MKVTISGSTSSAIIEETPVNIEIGIPGIQGTPGVTDHNLLSNKGTNTHAQIDLHIASTSNPHSVTKTQVGLGNVPNTDATNPANITQSSSYRFVSDAEKTTWNGKEDAITAGTTSQYWRGDKTWQTLDKTAVGLSNVVNLDTSTTVNITDSLNKRFVTDVDLTNLGNLSGTNTGDQDLSGLVPYSGATANVDLGGFSLMASDLYSSELFAETLRVYDADNAGYAKINFSGGTFQLLNFDDSPGDLDMNNLGANFGSFNQANIGTCRVNVDIELYDIANDAYGSLSISDDVYSFLNFLGNPATILAGSINGSEFNSPTLKHSATLEIKTTATASPIKFYTQNVNYYSFLSGEPTLQLDSNGANSANAGKIVFRTSGGSESATMTFDASANVFKFLYGATNVFNFTSNGVGIGTTAPSAAIHAISTSSNGQGRFGFNSTAYYNIRGLSTGEIYHNAVGSSPGHSFQLNGTEKLGLEGESLTLTGNSNPEFKILGPDSGAVIGADWFYTFESGLYATNGDETIASYNYDDYVFYYFNRAMYGNDSNIFTTAIFYPKQSASDPTYNRGAIYFNTTLNKLRVGGATGWETITSV